MSKKTKGDNESEWDRRSFPTLLTTANFLHRLWSPESCEPRDVENALTSITSTEDLTVPHVLISVALEESQETLDLESWRRWLTGCPALVKYARI